MRARYLFLLTICVLAPIFSANAQSGEESVRQIQFDTIYARATEPVAVGVEPMKYIGNQYITADDSSVMLWATNVVQSDIDFYADFQLVQLDSFFLKVYEIKELDMLGWDRLGAQHLVRLEAEFPGSNIRIYWRLFDVKHNQQIDKGQVEYHRAYWRELAHDISNEIVYRLTGDPGIFRTKIAYIKKISNGVKEVFIADYDGANERQVTKTGSSCMSPEFSRDGKEIFFTSFMNGKADLFKVNVETGKIAKVAQFEGINAAPNLSPDGQKIAAMLSKDGDAEIYVLKTDGSVIKRLTTQRSIETGPCWSPDGERIVFASDRTGSPQLYIMDDDGVNEKRLTFRGRYNDSPCFNSRGDRIVFVSRGDNGLFNIASVDPAGREYRLLTDIGTNENPHFSPDGKHVLFSSTRLGGSDLYTMNSDGRDQRRLTRSGAITNPTWGPLPRR